MPTHQVSRRTGIAARPPADLFIPVQRGPVEHAPDPAAPAAGRATGLRPVAIVAVLLSGLLGVVAIATFPEPDRATTRNAPSVAPERPLDDVRGSDGVRIAVAAVPPGTAVNLPGADSRDWVAPGARSDGALVRADRAEESIEFRAATTRPGRPGAFRLSWTGGTPLDESGAATTMLGIRPGGWVAFVVRPLGSPAELVVHLGGTGAAVTVATENGSTRGIVSAAAAVATVALPAATAATVTVTAEGDLDVAVATAELRDV